MTGRVAAVAAALTAALVPRQRQAPHPGEPRVDPAPTLRDLHRLHPCALCPTRMAVPGQPVCTICDAVTLPALVPDTIPEGAFE